MGLPLAEYGETLKKRFFKIVRYSLIFVPQLGRIQTGRSHVGLRICKLGQQFALAGDAVAFFAVAVLT